MIYLGASVIEIYSAFGMREVWRHNRTAVGTSQKSPQEKLMLVFIIRFALDIILCHKRLNHLKCAFIYYYLMFSFVEFSIVENHTKINGILQIFANTAFIKF